MLLKHCLTQSNFLSLLTLFLILAVHSLNLPCACGASADLPRRGQMVITTRTPQSGTWPIELRVSLFVEAPPRILWRILTDYNNLDEFVPHLRKSAITARRKNRVYLEQHFRHFLLRMNLDLEIMEEPPHRIAFRRYGGNMKTYTGHWELEQVDAGNSIFTLTVKAEPDFPVPQKVMAWVFKRELPKGLMAMRKRACEISGQEEPPYSIEIISSGDF